MILRDDSLVFQLNYLTSYMLGTLNIYAARKNATLSIIKAWLYGNLNEQDFIKSTSFNKWKQKVFACIVLFGSLLGVTGNLRSNHAKSSFQIFKFRS